MLISKTATVKWHSVLKKYFESKGYVFTKMGDEFEVKVEHLTKGSFSLVEYRCDYCKGDNQTDQISRMRKYSDLIKMRKTGLDCCGHMECKAKKISESKLSKPIKEGMSLGERNPELIKYWSDKNKKSPFDYSYRTNQKVLWNCQNGHEYDMPIQDRACGSNCPYCSSRRFSIEKSLGNTNKEISDEWHPSKNGDLTPYDIMAKSNKVYWWLGKCGHEWESNSNNRLKGNGCPYCSNRKANKDNCLSTLFPSIAKEWNNERNGNLKPTDVTSGTHEKVWWKCKKCKHEWEAMVYSRTQAKHGCSVCKESVGEKKIRKFLSDKKMVFIPQYKIKGLVGIGGNPLKFDFGIINKNKQLKCLIEFDGIFHFQKVYEEDGHEKVVEHDIIKNRYCENNNIKLIRIPYWRMDEINDILEEELRAINI